MKGGIVNSSGLVAEWTDMKPAIRTLVITCLTAALLCPIQALAVELNPTNQVSADEYIEAVMEEYGKYGITMRVIDDSNKLDSPILRETLETELSEIRAQCAAHATESRSELVPSNASASHWRCIAIRLLLGQSSQPPFQESRRQQSFARLRQHSTSRQEL